MPGLVPHRQAFNQTRQVYLATDLAVAETHWSRLRGLLGTSEGDFRNGSGLWIRPCRGVHTLAMRFPIDVVYLDRAGHRGASRARSSALAVRAGPHASGLSLRSAEKYGSRNRNRCGR